MSPPAPRLPSPSLPRLGHCLWLAVALAAATAASLHAATPAPTPAAPSAEGQAIEIPGADGKALRARWFPPAQGEGARPAVVALHGCGGLFNRSGRLAQRYREAAARLQGAGYAVLLPDSLGSRGARRLCQTRYAERSVTVPVRVGDARAALAWLAAQPGVDPDRRGLLGWSNGATTALNALEQLAQRGDGHGLAGAAVYYPGCAPLLRRGAQLGSVPLLMMLGEKDDWTPAQPCIEFAQQLQARPGADVRLYVYPDSYHGFDGTAPVRLRTDVPNGAHPQGVHQGGHPEAREQSRHQLDVFWQRVFAGRTAP